MAVQLETLYIKSQYCMTHTFHFQLSCQQFIHLQIENETEKDSLSVKQSLKTPFIKNLHEYKYKSIILQSQWYQSLYVKNYCSNYILDCLLGWLACTRKLMGSFVKMHASTNFMFCRHCKQHVVCDCHIQPIQNTTKRKHKRNNGTKRKNYDICCKYIWDFMTNIAVQFFLFIYIFFGVVHLLLPISLYFSYRLYKTFRDCIDFFLNYINLDTRGGCYWKRISYEHYNYNYKTKQKSILTTTLPYIQTTSTHSLLWNV